MRCKQCSESFPKGKAHDRWELKRQSVEPEHGGETSHVHLQDAGVFCSRNCLQNYLRSGDRSGIFDLGSKKTSL